MNFKSTMYLAFVLAILALGYLWLQTQPGAADGTAAVPKPSFGRSLNERDLIETKDQPGDLVKITVRRKGEEEWVFERPAPTSLESGDPVENQWTMTAPVAMEVAAHEVDRIARQIRALRYEFSYAISDPGAPTLAGVGLDPPETVVTLVDADGKRIELEIGRAASEQSVYVRLAGRDGIAIANSALEGLFKETALAYRDMQLWKFAPENVTGVDILDRSDPAHEIRYTFAKSDGRWMMESPLAARATSKLDDLARTLSTLRAVGWHDSRPERLASYGLQPATWTIKITVEESAADEAMAEESEVVDQEAPAPPSTKIRELTLHLSNRSPIGEDTKLFMRIGEEPIVGAIMKYAADKFKPDMTQWREMSVTTANVTDATRVELSAANDTLTLVKIDGGWSFEPEGGRAEEAAVNKYLSAVKALKAVAYVDGAAGDLAAYGLAEPQAQIRLTIPGEEEVERLSLGGFSDAETRRLVYARRNEMTSVAKIRASDAQELTPGRHLFEDRTILDVPSSRIDRLVIISNDHCTATPITQSFELKDGNWAMTSPVAAAVHDDALSVLVDTLARLRAESIVPRSDQSVLGSLDTAVARISVEYSAAASEDGSDESDQGPQPKTENQDRRESVTLNLAIHEERYYARRADAPTAFEVTKDFFDKVLAEYRDAEILAFDAANVSEFTVRNEGITHGFLRQGSTWRYQPEPDLPLDGKKVDNLLLQFKDLKTERFVGYGVADLQRFGLANPAHEATIKLDDGTTLVLQVSSDACTIYPEDGFYANVAGRGEAFLLKPDTVNRITVVLDELERKP